MGGSVIGGRKTAITIKQKYGENYYRKLGATGGRRGAKDGAIKGFAYATPEQRKEWGRKGGRISKRGPVNPKLESKIPFYEGPMTLPERWDKLEQNQPPYKPSLLERLLRKK